MRMLITVDNLTTNKALAILSALETAEALHETDVNVNVLPSARSEGLSEDLSEGLSEGLAEDRADAPSERLVIASEPETEPETTEMETETEDAPVQRHKRRGYRPQPIVGVPLIGRAHATRLIPLTAVQAMLGWGDGRLTYLVNTRAVESVAVQHGAVRYHFLTPEQVDVLRLAMELAKPGRRLSRRFLRQVTEYWKASHSRDGAEPIALSA